MAGYVWHLIHTYETYEHLSLETKVQMPKDAFLKFMIGAIVPDLATGNNKLMTHYCMNHPIYGDSYRIPNMEKVNKLFLRKEPTYLGVVSHLKYDVDHINRFLLVYAKPCGDGIYENTITGEKISGDILWGNWKHVYGQLYKLYDKFNGQMAVRFTPKLNEFFDTDFAASKDGFLKMMKWLFPGKMPMSKIPQMDDYRNNDDIHGILKTFFDNDGSDCKLNADIDDLVKIVKKSAIELSEQIDLLYAI